MGQDNIRLYRSSLHIGQRSLTGQDQNRQDTVSGTEGNIRTQTVAHHGNLVFLETGPFHDRIYHILVRFPRDELRFFTGSRFDSRQKSARVGNIFAAFDGTAYIGMGSHIRHAPVNKPAGDYHLELVTGNQDFAKTLVRVMRAFRLSARMTDRKNDYIVYLKDGDTIISFLNVIGAHQALMDFESVRVIKDMRNQVNRLVNCETANLQKTVNAALRQVESIQLIARTTGLHNLPAPLREAAEVRLAHPEATLSELVEALDGRISKSGMNHRLRKLEQLAADMTQERQL